MYPGTWAATHPDKPALIMSGSGRVLTYGELEENSTRLASYLRDRGLVPATWSRWSPTTPRSPTRSTGRRCARGSTSPPSTYLHICSDEDGRELPPGEVGTVYFERDTMPFAYHNDEDKTRSTQHPDHPTWTTVGDLGYADEEGFLFLTDRKAFMIISGGVNIYPQEIEDLFSLHPAVHDIAVIGVPDEEMGERVVAFVQVAEGREAGPELAEKLRGFARDRIAGFKVPREVVFRDELPRTPTGKMVKGQLRREYAG